ncbi:MAG TPA: protein kinase [Kofleriaceae bacterium]|nr:protein kinase [Kofleriaceae bacterium]
MESDPTQLGIEGEKHPTLAELKDPSLPHIHSHLANCSMCRSVVEAQEASAPVTLDLPKGLVTESAFMWPADPMARGGMAQIFSGTDRRLGRTVILKAPREGDDLPPGVGDMFQRRVTAEARILAKLQHPSIVTIYELGKSTVGWPFCVMERVDGSALRDRLDELVEAEKDGKPRTRERLELLSNLVAIAEALAYAHERKVVHRDCTPNNIIIGKRGEATLIDWGIARDLEAPGDGDAARLADQPPSMSGRMVTISAGTPPYLPLEQSQGRAADPSFDVYSFGITLYEVVSGKTPFEWRVGEGPGDRTKQLDAFLDWLRSDDPVPPAMPRDPELSGIIARAMHKDASQRFTADELVRALKQYLTGDLVFSHRYSATGRLSRWVRRNKAAAVSLLSLVAFAIAGVLVWGYLSKKAQEEAELRAMTAAAQADASEKGRAADEATRAADEAKRMAEEAQRRGENSDTLRAEAEKKRKAAEALRNDANEAAARAKGQADDAMKRFQEAMKQKEEAEKVRDAANAERDTAKAAQADAERLRDSAKMAQAVAEKERDVAYTARANAEKDRDTAKAAQTSAEQDRDTARAGQANAEKERDAARTAQAGAEKERDAAVAARTAAERERDEARRKIAELEQRLRERLQPPPEPPPPAPTP